MGSLMDWLAITWLWLSGAVCADWALSYAAREAILEMERAGVDRVTVNRHIRWVSLAIWPLWVIPFALVLAYGRSADDA
jgi:hypothetical protein